MQTKIQNILKRLLQLHPKSIDLSLDRIKRLLKNLNNPENKIENAIQVIGTNGKHSVCSALREIFETAGYSVNMNISPSLKKFNESGITDNAKVSRTIPTIPNAYTVNLLFISVYSLNFLN